MDNDSEQLAIVCIHIFDDTAPVKLVSRLDGDWCFLCGGEHEDDAGAYRVIGINHLFDRDETLNEVKDLPEGWEAERKVLGGKWLRTNGPCDA